MLATDGLFDNMDEEEMCAIVDDWERSCAYDTEATTETQTLTQTCMNANNKRPTTKVINTF